MILFFSLTLLLRLIVSLSDVTNNINIIIIIVVVVIIINNNNN